MGSKSALIKAGIALLVLAPVLWFLLGIADHGGFPHHPVQLLYASVGVRIVTGLIVGTGLILLAVGLVLRFRKPPQPFSTPAIVTADGNPVYPVIGYTPDGQPVTSKRNCQYLWIGLFQATSVPVDSVGAESADGVMSVGRSSSLPLWKIAPARTRATRCGALTARQRACAASISL